MRQVRTRDPVDLDPGRAHHRRHPHLHHHVIRQLHLGGPGVPGSVQHVRIQHHAGFIRRHRRLLRQHPHVRIQKPHAPHARPPCHRAPPLVKIALQQIHAFQADLATTHGKPVRLTLRLAPRSRRRRTGGGHHLLHCGLPIPRLTHCGCHRRSPRIHVRRRGAPLRTATQPGKTCCRSHQQRQQEAQRKAGISFHADGNRPQTYRPRLITRQAVGHLRLAFARQKRGPPSRLEKNQRPLQGNLHPAVHQDSHPQGRSSQRDQNQMGSP